MDLWKPDSWKTKPASQQPEYHDRELLGALARDTGGYYVDVDKGLKDLKPRRRAMPPGIAQIRAEQERLRKRIDELTAGLRSDVTSERRDAAAKLAAMGKQAVGAVGPLVAVLADDEESVRAAATDALVKMGVQALPALAKAAMSDDAETVICAAQALTALGDRARSALPALQKATTHSDPRAAEAARKAMAAIGQ